MKIIYIVAFSNFEEMKKLFNNWNYVNFNDSLQEISISYEKEISFFTIVNAIGYVLSGFGYSNYTIKIN